MKRVQEVLAELCAVAAALLWFISARIRLKERKVVRRGLDHGEDDPKALMLLVHEQSCRSAWAAIAAGLTALFAWADGLVTGT
jgi:hypothetical protein